MKKEYKIEIRRKFLHMLVGISMVFLMRADILSVFDLFLILVLGIALSFVLKKWSIPIISPLLHLFERKHTHPGKGAITFFVGCILALKLFPEDIAYASIMVLALGDGIATIIGIFFGKTKSFLSETKLLEGTVVGIILGTLGAGLFIPLWEACIAATISMSIEATEIKLNNKVLSDNILVPLVAGTTVLLLRDYMIF